MQINWRPIAEEIAVLNGAPAGVIRVEFPQSQTEQELHRLSFIGCLPGGKLVPVGEPADLAAASKTPFIDVLVLNFGNGTPQRLGEQGHATAVFRVGVV